jgi:hypothetical protein
MNVLCSLQGDLYFAARCLLRLLGEDSHNHNALALCGNIEGPCDAILALEPKLPERALEVLRILDGYFVQSERLNECYDMVQLGAYIGRLIVELLLCRPVHYDRPWHATALPCLYHVGYYVKVDI